MKAKLISNIWKVLFICTTIFISGSCTDDTFHTENPDAEAGAKIFIKVPAPSVSQTRADATSDDYYNGDGVYLLLFNGNNDDSKLLQSVRTSAGTENTLYAKLKNNANAKHIYIVANVESYIKDWGENTTLGEIKEALKMSLPQTKGVLTAIVTPQPMIGYAYLENGIQDNVSIGTTSAPIFLNRSTAKISLYNQASNMKLEGANLISAPVAGYLFDMPTKLSGIAKANSGKGGDIEEMLITPAKDEQNCELYTYESDDTKSTAIVIKATYLNTTYFYRIDLNTKEAKYALNRNFNYIVTIKAVEKMGYKTAEEAINNPAANLKYDINVVDAYARDIISNGTYYLGVSNTEYYAFADAISADEVICTVSHNAPKDIVGSFSVEEGDITLASTSFPAGNGTDQNITLKISSVPTTFTEGKIKIMLGNLERTITIRKESKPSKFGALLNNLVKKGYISGMVDEKDKEWLKLTAESVESELTEEALFARLEDVDGNIHIRVKANMGDDTSPQFRTGHVDLFRKDEIGNARVMIKQSVHDIYTDVQGQAKITTYTYVGTFHRHNQMGERIIRVKTDITGQEPIRWQVRVLSGDFIKLSNEGSKDPGVGRDFYGIGDNTTIFGDAVEKYPVEGNHILIDNPAGSKEIYFRVGLKSTIAANATRYGILGLFVNDDITNDKVTRYIFVRQGEAADYLMRPEDPVNEEPSSESKNVIMTSRPLAVKISPFNLTDKRNPDEIASNLTGTRGEFADYPSQAGYLYQPLSNKGWWADPNEKPTIAEGDGHIGNVIVPVEWDQKYESCPQGYHRPMGDTNNVGYAGGKVEESPMRQSFWLYPKNGGISNTQNSIIGYIADGFYDRQPMWHNPETDGIKQPTAVNHKSKIAYMGVLTFNPRTLASIFMPLTGSYAQISDYKFSGAGLFGGFYTRSKVYDQKVYWTVDYGMMTSAVPGNNDYYAKFRVDNYASHSAVQASNIRCVKD